MIKNCSMIETRFPNAIVYIYITEDVPPHIVEKLRSYSNTLLISSQRQQGEINTFDRFLAIDRDDVDFVFVRDADSRVTERDACCIEDFMQTKKALHIIRDHRLHTSKIMGGMFGLRKCLFPYNMKDLVKAWLGTVTSKGYGVDQAFLRDVIYNKLVGSSATHDRVNKYEGETHLPFRAPIVNREFIGQEYNFKNGDEITMYDT
jgi:hypothetical protein